MPQCPLSHVGANVRLETDLVVPDSRKQAVAIIGSPLSFHDNQLARFHFRHELI